MSARVLVRLSDISEQGQYGLNAAAMKEGLGVRFIRITDIDEKGELRTDGVAYVPSSTERLDTYVLTPGDLIIARSGATAGKSLLYRGLNEPAVFAGYLIRFRIDKTKAVPDFVAYYFKSSAYWGYINATKRAAAQPNINAQELGSIPLPLPSLPEQHRIVDLLSRAEGIVRLRREAEKKAAELIPALFNDMFGDPMSNPKGWPVEALESVAKIISGATKGRRFDPSEAIELPYMRVANVKDGYLDLTEIKTIAIKRGEIEKYRLMVGDLLLTEGGDPDKLGRGALWAGEIDTCLHQNHIYKVRADRSNLLPEYLCELVGSRYGKAYFLRVAKKTTGIATINRTQLGRFAVVVPPLARQADFGEKLSSIRSIQSQQSTATAKAQATFEALLANAFEAA